MIGVARKGLAAGMNVVLMNQRNCGGMDHYAPTLYNSSLSSDVAAVANSVIENDGVSRLALVGFSMGGNLVLKCAGEWGGAGPAQFKAVAAVCPAMDLAASAGAWFAAVDAFEASEPLRDYLGERFVAMFSKVKRIEQDRFFEVVSPLDYDWYLKSV